MCGGTTAGACRCTLGRGLSPRVRGNLVQDFHEDLLLRSIPACAGEPHGLRASQRLFPVYPRVCGGTLSPRCDSCQPVGLSPRVRGNRAAWQRAIVRLRSIPACAGEPRRGLGTETPIWVYPRVCGGTAAIGVARISSIGLSPRVRGNHSVEPSGRQPARSIPACAGEP